MRAGMDDRDAAWSHVTPQSIEKQNKGWSWLALTLFPTLQWELTHKLVLPRPPPPSHCTVYDDEMLLVLTWCSLKPPIRKPYTQHKAPCGAVIWACVLAHDGPFEDSQESERAQT